MTTKEYFSGLFNGIKSLTLGMSVTLKELFTKKLTQKYPENRDTLVIPPRARGELRMPVDSANEHACTACGICQMNCPNGTIKVSSKMVEQPDGKKKKVLTTYIYDLGMCTFCNLCVITCPSNAIEFSTEFENAVYNRDVLKMRLNPEGSKLREKVKTAAPTAVKKNATATESSPEKKDKTDTKSDGNKEKELLG